jgi:fructose-1,6-bisphosphatase/inositol monophosphatase family enzyme
MVTGPEGKPLSLQAGGGVLASNGLLHRDLLEMLK